MTDDKQTDDTEGVDNLTTKPLDPTSHEVDPAGEDDDLYLDDEDYKWLHDTDKVTPKTQRTSDSDDKQASWTVQDTNDDGEAVALTEELGEPGQRFYWDELPHAESVEKWNASGETWPKQLPLHKDAAEKVYGDSEKE